MPINNSFANNLLISMPSIKDLNFERTVIYICEHQSQGTVGLIINRPMRFSVNFIFEKMQINATNLEQHKSPLLFGGPTQPERGFVIHRPIGEWRSSLSLQEDVTVTTSNDIIRAIACDTGPKDMLITLGYVAWDANQLEQEIMNDSWLVCPFKPELLYDIPFAQRWEYAGLTIGVHMNQLTLNTGHA